MVTFSFLRSHLERYFIWLPCIGILFMISSCSDQLGLEKVVDPVNVSTRNDEDCQLEFVGQVLDAKSLSPIANATILLDGYGTVSDGNGMYRIAISDPLNSIDVTRLISVQKNGYEMDTYQFVPSSLLVDPDCKNTVSLICVDFVLSPKNAPVLVLPDQETKIQVRDTTRYTVDIFGEGLSTEYSITVLDLLIPAGSVDKPTEICLSTFARSSYLGALPNGYSLDLPEVRFRISSSPMIDLKKPFTVSFESTHPVGFTPDDPLQVYRFNDAGTPFVIYDLSSNRWKTNADSKVQYNTGSQKIEIQSRKLGSYLVTNEAHQMNVKESAQFGEVSSLGGLKNCNCADANYFNHDVTISGDFNFGFPNGGIKPILEQIIYLNDLKVMTNMPCSAMIKVGKGQGKTEFNQFVPDSKKSVELTALLGKCEQLYLTYHSIDQMSSGSIYGQSFGLSRSVGVRMVYDRDRCPTSSACHQGCP